MSESKEEIIERIKADLQSGRYFALGEMSARSHRGYEPCLSRRDWANVVEVVARMAKESDPLAQVASAVLRHLNLYGTPSQLEAAISAGALEAIKAQYDDVIARSGPEPPNSRFWKRPFSLDECIAIACWVQAALDTFNSGRGVPGRGWAHDEIAKSGGIRLPPETTS